MQDGFSASVPAPDALDRLWLVGCGAMGGALLGRWLEAGLAADRVTIIDPAPRGPVPEGVRSFSTFGEASVLAPLPTAVVLAVKPQQLREVASSLQPALVEPPLLVTMLAGVRSATIGALFPGARVARIMPNTPAGIGKGITVAHGPALDQADADAVAFLCRAAGDMLWMEEEARFDAVTALSGSGPAYLFRFIEALAGAGEAAGLDSQSAIVLARATVGGAAALALETDAPVATLRQQVTSAGGTTEAGLDVLDGDGALSALMRATVRAAAERSRMLAAQAESLVQQADPVAREAASA
ncbi:MAG: pyrroline-5-carboxylate reductase [Thermaurantiacus sp.]